MTANPRAEVDELRSASHAAADTAADASIVSEVSIASAAATETRTHQPRRPTAVRRSARAPTPAPEHDTPLPADRFLDRELSWLHFNQRVLELAEDPTVPLLERARFLAIFASNLDEFFMVRVAGLKRRIAAGVAVRAAAGLEPREVLEQICDRSRTSCMRAARRGLPRAGRPRWPSEGIELVRWDDLDRRRAGAAAASCSTTRSSRCSPRWPSTRRTRSPTSPGSRSTSPCVVRNPKTGKEHFARVKVPPMLPRCSVEPGRRVAAGRRTHALRAARGRHRASTSTSSSPAWRCCEHHTFRVTRNEDLEVEEDDAENLLKALEKELLRRRFGPPVRLEVEESIDPQVLDLLVPSSASATSEVYRLPGPLDLRGLHDIADLDRAGPEVPRVRPAHPPATWPRSRPPAPATSSPRCARSDVLLHHPYDSFSTSVQAFIEQAAADPHVLAIKQTLYRTSRRLPDRRRPHRRRRGRQAGAGARRDQGPLRRAGQHPLGPQARAGRLPRRLRPGRPQDPLQAVAGGARGGRGDPPLLPHRHRQLQPQDRPRSTRTSACSPPTRRSARTSPHLFNNLSGYRAAQPVRAAAGRARAPCAPA